MEEGKEGNHMGLPLRIGVGGSHPHLNLPPSRRPLRNPSISLTTAPITLTLILSQDGRGDKRGGYDGYAKVSIKREEVRAGVGCCSRDIRFSFSRFFWGAETSGFSCVIWDSFVVVVETNGGFYRKDYGRWGRVCKGLLLSWELGCMFRLQVG